MSYLVEFTEIISSTFWALGEKCILWAPGFVTFILDPPSRAAARAVYELLTCRIYWNVLDFYELWEKSAFYELRAFVTFILDPPSRAAAHVQFMSSEHADVYERGELDQDTGGDQDVDIR